MAWGLACKQKTDLMAVAGLENFRVQGWILYVHAALLPGLSYYMIVMIRQVLYLLLPVNDQPNTHDVRGWWCCLASLFVLAHNPQSRPTHCSDQTSATTTRTTWSRVGPKSHGCGCLSSKLCSSMLFWLLFISMFTYGYAAAADARVAPIVHQGAGASGLSWGEANGRTAHLSEVRTTVSPGLQNHRTVHQNNVRKRAFARALRRASVAEDHSTIYRGRRCVLQGHRFQVQVHFGLGRDSNSWVSAGWRFVTTIDPSTRFQGVAILVREALCRTGELHYQEVVPGRLLHVRVGQEHHSLDILGIYQHALHLEAGNNNLPQRLKVWEKLGALLHNLSRRNMLILLGDYNCTPEYVTGAMGHSYDKAGNYPDANEFAALLESHNLILLNGWVRRSQQFTFTGSKHKSIIDFVITRRHHADGQARQARTIPGLNFSPWRLGGRHLAVGATLYLFTQVGLALPVGIPRRAANMINCSLTMRLGMVVLALQHYAQQCKSISQAVLPPPWSKSMPTCSLRSYLSLALRGARATGLEHAPSEGVCDGHVAGPGKTSQYLEHDLHSTSVQHGGLQTASCVYAGLQIS